jgi:glycosyltransferase involved in cell wall biosynthesis
MKQQRPKILFVSHDSSRTGAPIVLLNFLIWLKKQDVFDFEIFSKNAGPLDKDFCEIAKVHFAVKTGLAKRVIKKVTAKISSAKTKYKLPGSLSNKKFDLIYLNTVDSLGIIDVLHKKFNCPIICHVHENDYTIKYYFPESVAPSNLQYVNHYIAASKSTKDNLVEKYDIPESKISLVYELISLDKTRNPTLSVAQVKKELGLTNEFIIGGSGLTSWRKGIDLFVQLAVELNRIKPNNQIKLLWVGNIYHQFKIEYEYEAGRLGIADKIIFTGVKPDAQNYFQAFDVFALTSREDPFPLVVLEAAAQKKPVVLFENSGGIPELFNNGEGGIIVPYGDVHAMAQRILSLQDQPDSLKLMGEQAESLVEKFDVNIIAKQLVEVIENTLNT